MARPGVSYFDVAQAATALQAANEQPTIERIRKKLGSGSNSTIAAHLKQWKTEHMPSVAEVSKTTLPATLLSQIQLLWDSLKDASQAELEQYQTQHKQHVQQSQQTISALQGELAQCKKQLAESQERIAALTNQLTESQTQLEEKTTDLGQLQVQFDAQSQRLTDKEETILTLREQLKNVTNNLEYFHQAAQQQRDEDALKHVAQINRLEQQNRKLENKLAEEKERTQQILIAQERAGFQVDHLSIENSSTKKQLEEKVQECRELTTQICLYADQLRVLNEQYDDLKKISESFQGKFIDTEKRLSASMAKYESLKQSYDKQDEKLEKLQKEREELRFEASRLKSALDMYENKSD